MASFSVGFPSRFGTRVRTGFLLTLAFGGVLGVGACAAPQPIRSLAPETSIEWSVGNDGSRVLWVKTVATPEDLGIAKGMWKRVEELLAGEDEQGIVRPYGVLNDPSSQRLYVADPGAGVIHCMDIGQGRYFVIRGTAQAPLSTPIGIALDARGRLYITDSTRGMVYRYTPEDRVLKPFLSERLTRPTGIAFNGVNHLLYISDTAESQVVAVDQNGVVQQRYGAAGDAEAEAEEKAVRFNRPTDIAVDRKGQIFVTDSLNFRITVMTPEGQVVRHFGDVGDARGFFSRPKGVAVDSAGHIYVCDALRDAIQVFDADGTPLLVLGRAGNGRGRFWMPSGLYIDKDDNIFVSDTYNKRVQIFRFVSGQAIHTGLESKVVATTPTPLM